MDVNWPEVQLNHIGKIITGKTPLTKVSEYFDGDIPFISPRDMDGSRYIRSTERWLSVAGAESVNNAIIPPNTVLVSCIGSDMGKAAIAGSTSVTNQQINSIIVDRKFDCRFIYYSLSCRKKEIQSLAGGSAQPILNKSDFGRITITVPPIGIQKSIAHILGTLDDKIELNRQMNATLEAMAQALFKSWFVDFDPVIDNALAAGNPIPEPLQDRAEARKALGDQRKPLPEGVGEQFPDRFVFDEEMGWVPEGWEVSAAEFLASKIAMGPFGSNIKVSTFVESGVPVISGQHLRKVLLTDNDFNYVTIEHADRLKNSKVTRGDIVFTHAGNIGQVSLIPNQSMFTEYVISQRQFYLRPDTTKVCSSYLIYYFRSPGGQHRLLSNASQVGVPSIARPSSHLKSIRLIVPSLEIMKYFDSICVPIFESMILGEQEIATLAKTRDILLPKLLSGQLSIPDAEKQVAEAT